MDQQWEAGLGLTAQSNNQEIQEAVFAFVLGVGHLMFSTICRDGQTPTTRAIEVHDLGDGDLFFGVSCGKPFYAELRQNPRVSGGVTVLTAGKLGIACRLNAEVAEVEEEAFYRLYWQQNPGTKALYRRNLENFRLFRMRRGEGELFDLCGNDQILRFRFGFGGIAPRTWHYAVSEACNGCGSCTEACLTGAIRLADAKAVIDYRHCLECGSCCEVCPQNAVACRDEPIQV